MKNRIINNIIHWIVTSLVILIVLSSCEKNITAPKNANFFLTGDSAGAGLNYQLLSKKIIIEDLSDIDKDTIVHDTLSIDFDIDGIVEFRFILSQRCIKDYEFKNPSKQEIKVLSDNLLMQIHPPFDGTEFNEDYNVIKSSSKGDTINNNKTWISRFEYFLTSRSGNSRVAPRTNLPYIPFKYTTKEKYGWIRFSVDYADDWRIKKLLIEGYCIKE